VVRRVAEGANRAAETARPPPMGTQGRAVRDLEQHLAAWREAKLVTAKQAAGIEEFERAREREETGRGILIAEAVGYVGAALAVAAVAILLGQQWDALNVGGRLAIVALLTVIVAGAGAALRGSDRAPIMRLVSVLLTAGVAGIAWLAGIISDEVLGWAGENVALGVGTVALALSLLLYSWRERALPQLAALASAILVVSAIFARPGMGDSAVWAGLAVWSVGAAWVLLGLGRWLRPEAIAVGFGAAVALIGVQVASFDDLRVIMILLGLATAGALLWRGVAAAETYLVTIGAIGVLVFVPQLVIELFGDAVAALVSMLVVGLGLVLLAVRLARGRKPKDAESAS